MNTNSLNSKSEILNSKQIQNSKQYDLEERTLQFAKEIRIFLKKIPKNISNIEDNKQLIRSSGSVGANYIEANESLSKKDFMMRIKISRKESKESIYWLKLLDCGRSEELGNIRRKMIIECTEIMKILGSIASKS